ncbi:type 1 glutamine amidotransferase domain-containing protein [Nocardia sp. NPDC057353]|uniref:type 1 glutamine amidotransferase domain-containing protein n=1 Tax=Nocardia sp. NPDC057353 TaxID=3346104 RepID=UPI0036344740
MTENLDGVRVLIITSQTGVEHDELLDPKQWLLGKNATVVHAAPERGDVQTFRHDTEKDEVATADTALGEVSPADFDILVIPGGTVNADKLRTEPKAVELATEFAKAGKPIAAICHGPWLLVEAGLVRGKTLTSYPSLRTDIGNAGGAWVDEAVVRSTDDGWTLITSRNPGDLPDFETAIGSQLVAAG